MMKSDRNIVIFERKKGKYQVPRKAEETQILSGEQQSGEDPYRLIYIKIISDPALLGFSLENTWQG